MAYIRTKNTIKIRSIPDIVLNELKDWGGNNFMSLYSGKKIIATNGKKYQLMKT